MLQIMLACTRTGRFVPTGIETDIDTFIALPEVLSLTRCPACGGNHYWTKSQTWICNAGCSSRALLPAEIVGHSLAVSSTYGRGPRWYFNQRHTLLADAMATDGRAPADVAHRRGNAFARFDLGPDQRRKLWRPQPVCYSGSAEGASSLLCGARARAP